MGNRSVPPEGGRRNIVPEGGERNTWRDTFVALGESLIEVLRAELAVIGEAWKGSLRHLGIALGFFAVAGYVALVCLPALLIFALVLGLQDLLFWAFAFRGLEWPLWATGLVVALLVALVVYLLVMMALKRLRERFENPVATVKERVADHTAWWNDRVLNGHGHASGATGLESDNDTAGAKGEANDAEQRHPRQDDAGDGSAGETPPGS